MQQVAEVGVLAIPLEWCAPFGEELVPVALQLELRVRERQETHDAARGSTACVKVRVQHALSRMRNILTAYRAITSGAR